MNVMGGSTFEYEFIIIAWKERDLSRDKIQNRVNKYPPTISHYPPLQCELNYPVDIWSDKYRIY